MHKLTILLAFTLPIIPTLAQSSYTDENGITLYEKWEVMESLLIQFQGLETSVNPCSFFQTGDPARGQQTSAEWVRIVFHDAITANLSAGTGGLDASIGFESDREENRGVAFITDTIQIFASFFSVYTSMADIIGLGLADTLISCDPDPKLIKLRVGRKDALVAGPFGVPGPADQLPFVFSAFAKAGFSPTEAIQSVACGHTLGAVNFRDHPEIIDESAVNQINNKDGTVPFDTTRAVFDNKNVVEYLTWTGSKGGPLASGHNQDTNSDFRLFNSDQNATIQGLSSGQVFQNTCYRLFEKMLDTVPSNVVLSDVIVPRTWTLPESRLELSNSGTVSYVAQVRSLFKTANPPNTAAFKFTTAQGGNTGTKRTNAGVTFNKRGYGRVTDYVITQNLTPSITGITIENSYTAPVDQRLFVVPSQSFRNNQGTPTRVVLRAALLTSLKTPTTTLIGNLFFGEAQVGSLSPKVGKITTTLTAFKTQGAYTIFQGVLELGGRVQTPSGISYVDVALGTSIVSKKFKQFRFAQCGNEDPLTC